MNIDDGNNKRYILLYKYTNYIEQQTKPNHRQTTTTTEIAFYLKSNKIKVIKNRTVFPFAISH